MVRQQQRCRRVRRGGSGEEGGPACGDRGPGIIPARACVSSRGNGDKQTVVYSLPRLQAPLPPQFPTFLLMYSKAHGPHAPFHVPKVLQVLGVVATEVPQPQCLPPHASLSLAGAGGGGCGRGGGGVIAMYVATMLVCPAPSARIRGLVSSGPSWRAGVCSSPGRPATADQSQQFEFDRRRRRLAPPALKPLGLMRNRPPGSRQQAVVG